ncbi:putative disease resistance protein RGA3 [Cocos nucifera]|uniref:Putative disease resistance protein RGA3 n=1 Tax=Cocos nucifera TaxID=13894 RepID=A0A8K0ICI2_COCNU|nr:putative disease resistance protein RGA3 [Cocos nucifera]
MYDADDILDLCLIEADKHSEGSSSNSSIRFSFPFLPAIRKLPVDHEIGTKIRELNKRLEEIWRWRSEFNLELISPNMQRATSQISRKTSPVGEIDIVGSEIEEHTQSLVDSLIKDDRRRNILVFAIVGAGGIGKTTLAKRIHNDRRIEEGFSVKKWVCVSQDFDDINLLKDIYDGTRDDLAGDQSRSSLEPKVQSSLGVGSLSLQEMNRSQIAMQMMAVNTHHMDKLSLDDSWSLLCKKVVLTGEEGEIQHLKDIGMEFVKKCDGLPLAIKAVAGVLCMKEKTRRAWNRVLESTAWSTAGLPEEVMGALYLSYEDLPSYLKQCFVYCSLFPEDYVIDMDYITQLWIAEGFVKAEGSSTMEDTAKEYYRELIMRNLLQPYLSSRRVCQMHDLLHCLARPNQSRKKMTMILDAFVSKFADLLVELAKEEVDMLLGVPGEIKKLQNNLRKIGKVLIHAERKRIDDKAVDDWLKELQDVMYDADDLLDLCRIEVDKRSEGSSSNSLVRFSLPFFSRIRKLPVDHEIGTKIRELNKRLEDIWRWRSELNLELTFPDMQRVTSQKSRNTSPVAEIDIVGSEIKEHTQSLVDLLIKDDRRRNIHVFAIVGTGGIGKTTLAKRIYNDRRIQEEFSVKKWVCVSQDFDDIILLKDIYDGTKDDLAGDQSRSSLEPKVERSLGGKKLFLVLDDVWTAKVWCELLCNTLKSCAAGSRILLTTRNEQIARQMLAVDIRRVNKLSVEDGWSLLCKKVVLTGEEGEIQHLKDIGMEIVKKCDGLPLAIKALAGVLCTKEKTRSAWHRVLGSTAWSTFGLPEEVKGALYLSYEDLPSSLKQCFIYCSLFPIKYTLNMHYITQLWIAEGFVKAEGSSTIEEIAEDYCRELTMRNLLQPDFRMHDLLHCLARYMARDESSAVRKVHELGSSNELMKVRRVFLRDNETTEIPDVFVKQESLRTLMWPRSLMSEAQMDVVFNKLYRLRVVDMSYSKIQRLPDSLGNLIHLRYLNISQTKISVIPETLGNLRNLRGLDMSSTEISVIPESIGNLTNLRRLDIFRTKISVIPESIGNLRNLQFLEMRECQHLSRLPNSIVNLHNLRSLRVDHTEVFGMPAGLGSLQNLHTLHGFKQQGNRSEGWCTIEELRSLSCLTDLSIQKLECISSSSQARAAELRNKPKLSILKLRCTRDLQPSKEEMRRIEEVFEELHPPPSLEELWIEYYFGREFPKWMAETSSSASIHFPNLRRLYLLGCRYSERFPPSRLLPNLEFLEICDSAASVIDVGPEFSVGTGSTSSGGGRAGVDTSKYAFPRLETLVFRCLPNWQEWHWDKGTQAMPCLNYLSLQECPKLMSLPEGLLLHATSLTELKIWSADSLTTIEYLLSLTTLDVQLCPNLEKVSDLPMLTTLEVRWCPNLEKISDHPMLTTLEVEKCPKLKVLENLQSLKIMELIDYEMKSLPSYLLTGVQRDKKKRKRVHVAHLEKLEIRCSIELIRKICQRASPEWPTIQDIQQVHAYSWDRLRSVHVLYNKSPFRFTTNFNDTTASSSSDMLSSSSGIGL